MSYCFNISDCSGGSLCFIFSLVAFNLITHQCTLTLPFLPLSSSNASCFKCTDFSNLCGEENRDHTGIAFLKLPVPRVEHQPEELAFAICKRGNGHGIWQAQPMTFYVLAFEELKSRFDSF